MSSCSLSASALPTPTLVEDGLAIFQDRLPINSPLSPAQLGNPNPFLYPLLKLLAHVFYKSSRLNTTGCPFFWCAVQLCDVAFSSIGHHGKKCSNDPMMWPDKYKFHGSNGPCKEHMMITRFISITRLAPHARFCSHKNCSFVPWTTTVQLSTTLKDFSHTASVTNPMHKQQEHWIDRVKAATRFLHQHQ